MLLTMASVAEACLLSIKLALRLAPPSTPALPPASDVLSTVTAATAGAEDDDEVPAATEG